MPIDAKGDTAMCNYCHTAAADRRGDHSLLCAHGGKKTLLHNEIRDVVFEYASAALLTAVREPHPFVANPSLRLDISFTVHGIMHLIDVAVTHPRQGGGYMEAAALTPGGAATKYEATKVAKYGSRLERHQKLFPAIVDTYGAWSDTGHKVISLIASAWGKRYGVPTSSATRILYCHLNFVLARGVARILTGNKRVPPSAELARLFG
jgi:hypothetical protein